MDEKRLKNRGLQFAVFLYCALFFQLTYSAAAVHAANQTTVSSFVFPFEHFMPFVSWMIIPYMSSGLFFALVPFCCRSREELWVYTKRFSFITIFSICCFFIFPLRFSFDRPSVEHPVFKFFFTFLSKHDSPFNQAPSLHVAYACLFWSVLGRQLKGWTRWVVGIWLLFMGIATLTVYQHHLVDVLTALILVHVGFVLFPSPSGLLHDSALSTLKAAGLPFLSGTEKMKLDEKAKLDLEAEVCRRNQGIGNVYYAIGWCLLLLALWGGTHAFGLYLLCWPSLVCIAVGRNYVINNPRFLKNEKGWMPVFKKLVYSPYQWIYWLLWRFVRRRNNPPLLEILPRCYVGPRTTAGDLRVLGLNKHLVVFDLAAELEEITILHVQENYQSFPLLDVAAITLADAEKILAALVIRYQQLQRDENMIIHCTMGYSRSMIFAVLLSQKILSLDLMDAIDLVKSHNKHLVLHKHALKLMEVLVERNS
ncbi:hypothetical protein BCY89_21585 [Sphingobacterium siyangense]|uniref:Tyrosine specific protein phosphatases domain-containing protein n=1 Tax=Sphingobacterium siyangense TaxID=459529 RepID=A0A420G755_9SPHI|nr:phosphatase PAP2 family protein [Sphingobacterium siyangense]RKF41017.1 hypothetical protein BCY89_21585 [Sphingobacterium siyangense]